ncbi:hypothetical protein [Pseudomonas fluorescens]|uniref:Uncharacterized protein n=1 Tax=Pseudomonas fluorescens TaxID=294 RepID=A0A4Y9TI78_PSEFL|nr:hypothetical protein [Pseudomonas fluorescens]TFW42139.1 hypothetical protein E4T65_17255 [Pseudomonas fluorescens]
MSSVLLIGGALGGSTVDVTEFSQEIELTALDGQKLKYVYGWLKDGGENMHHVYTLAGSDPVIELLAYYKRS